MRLGWILGSTVVTTAMLVLFNAFLFPLVFPGGLAETFMNAREPQLMAYRLLGFLCTGGLLSFIVAFSDTTGARDTLMLGGMLGLLVALPEHLHLYAMTTAPAGEQFLPVLWTVVTWALVVGAAGWVVARGKHAPLMND